MRVEIVNGLYLLCGCTLDRRHIKVGQKWADASGRTIVTVMSEGEWIDYKWTNGDGFTFVHTKDQFSFQCRYFMVLPSDEIPAEYNAMPARIDRAMENSNE